MAKGVAHRPASTEEAPGSAPALETGGGWRMGLPLFVSRVGSAGLLFVANVYLAQALGPREFGRYALAVSFLSFMSLFLDLGHFSAGARLLSQVDGHRAEARGLVGALSLVLLLVGLLFLIFVGASSLVVDGLFTGNLSGLLGRVLPLAPALTCPLLMEQVLKALDRPRLLAAWSVASRGAFVVALAALSIAGSLDALGATRAYLAGILMATLAVLPLLRPTLRNWRSCLQKIHAEHLQFGRPLYAGRLANLVSYRTDTLLLGFFRDPAAVGQYSLAMSVANLLAFYSTSLAATHFRQLGQQAAVPQGLLRTNALGLTLLGALGIVCGELILLTYLGSAYSVAAWILVPCVAAVALQGCYQPYNSWLLAHGYGRELASFLFVVAVINICANLVLIPTAGAAGAAVASIIGMGAYFLLARREVRRLVTGPS